MKTLQAPRLPARAIQAFWDSPSLVLENLHLVSAKALDACPRHLELKTYDTVLLLQETEEVNILLCYLRVTRHETVASLR